MGFRNPIRSVSAVDTGAGNRRVVITQNDSPQGGGQVLLYTSSGQPASLAAGSDDSGIGAVLASPPNGSGVASSVTVRGVAAGGEGIGLYTPGSVTVNGVPLLTDPIFRARRQAAQALPSGAFTPIVWDTFDADASGMGTAGSPWITARRAGYWLALGQVGIGGAPGGRTAVRFDGKTSAGVAFDPYIGELAPNGAVANPGVTALGLIYLGVGDQVQVSAFQDAGVFSTASTDFSPTVVHLLWLRP